VGPHKKVTKIMTEHYELHFTCNYFLPPFIIQSVHYKTVSTTYVVESKILHYPEI